METIRTAVVVKATGSRYMLHDLASQATVEGRLRGRLRLSGSRSTSPVVSKGPDGTESVAATNVMYVVQIRENDTTKQKGGK